MAYASECNGDLWFSKSDVNSLL